MKKIVKAEIMVSGKVQGVFYRAFARTHANRLAIKGYAQNLSDGRVKVVAIGSKSNLSRFIELLKIGPPMAKVNSVEVEWFNVDENFHEFSIL